MSRHLYIIIIFLSTFSFSGLNGQRNQSFVFFSQQPLKGKTEFYPPDSLPKSRHTQKDVIKRLLMFDSGNPIIIDSGSLFTTNFTYQKRVSFNYDDFQNLESNIQQVAFQVLQNSFLLPIGMQELTFNIRRTEKDIFFFGRAIIYECTATIRGLKEKKEMFRPSTIVLIFKNIPNASKLSQSGFALVCDSLEWHTSKELKDAYFSVHHIINGRNGNIIGEVTVPMIFDINNKRFSPIAHFSKSDTNY
jgi:hypothetical protein